MKTTVDLNDALFLQAKQLAEQQQQSFKSVLEEALRQFLDANIKAKPKFQLRKHSFGGDGLHPDIAEGDWTQMRDAIYAGRGG